MIPFGVSSKCVRISSISFSSASSTDPEGQTLTYRWDFGDGATSTLAVVELVPGSAVSRNALLAFCRKQLAGYKVPRVLEIWSSIPRLPDSASRRG